MRRASQSKSDHGKRVCAMHNRSLWVLGSATVSAGAPRGSSPRPAGQRAVPNRALIFKATCRETTFASPRRHRPRPARPYMQQITHLAPRRHSKSPVARSGRRRVRCLCTHCPRPRQSPLQIRSHAANAQSLPSHTAPVSPNLAARQGLAALLRGHPHSSNVASPTKRPRGKMKSPTRLTRAGLPHAPPRTSAAASNGASRYR